MKATRICLTLVALVFCGNGYASPCKPKPSTATILTSSEIPTTTATISVAESSVTTFALITSESATSESATSESATSESLISESTATMSTAITSLAEPSSTAILTSSDAPTTTTAVEESSPSSLFINPSFDEPTDLGQYDGSPWMLKDDVSPLSVSIKSDLAHTGLHSAYWSVTNTVQNGRIYQRVDLEQSTLYKLSYWWYVDEVEQPTGLDTCFISMTQDGVDGLSRSFPEFFFLPSTLPLSTWTKREIPFNSINITPAFMTFSVTCYASAGSGLKIAIDDITLSKA
ncbi:hypothetical protein FPOAC1_000037 [Fusarium poae]|uniref:hypothetical protein n=1 Tax=Fusarium poae TaxID=36050 RepID=UPI001CEAF7FB|nr:hypothetical protein FPOAC1_000037 [Fusarium poae]KAG8674074.1 hypothetical protein FPOAC1_000037 [Fusarium poae]